MTDLFLDPSASIHAAPRDIQRALLMSAPGHQGGHSDAGKALSEVIGVRFPLHMDDLISCAKKLDFEVGELWPWLPVISRRTKSN